MINLDKILIECFECDGTGKGGHHLDDPYLGRNFTIANSEFLNEEPIGLTLCERCGGSGQISNDET